MEILIVVALLAVVVLVFVIVADPAEQSADTSKPSSPTPASTEEYTAKVGHIIDGDTVVVSVDGRQQRLRLEAIDCPEIGQHWGDTAKYGLIKLIGGRSIRFQSQSSDPYGRTLATIFVYDESQCEWVDVNARMVLCGHAWVSRLLCNHLPKDRQDELLRIQRWARGKKVGLWRDSNPIPPWKWRNGNSKQHSNDD